jgi:hypothetical protein
MRGTVFLIVISENIVVFAGVRKDIKKFLKPALKCKERRVRGAVRYKKRFLQMLMCTMMVAG